MQAISSRSIPHCGYRLSAWRSRFCEIFITKDEPYGISLKSAACRMKNVPSVQSFPLENEIFRQKEFADMKWRNSLFRINEMAKFAKILLKLLELPK